MMSGFEHKRISVSELLGRPLNLVEEKYAPRELFVSGVLKIPFEGLRVAVIGTREPSKEGLDLTEKLVIEFVRRDWIVVSGLARGIDTKAHKTALEKGGKTIAVLGTPIEKCYPPENKDLQEEIRKKGLLISQFPQSAQIQRKNFVIRNRTMALLSHATVITDAGETSGVVSQGWETLRLGRLLFISKELEELEWAERMVEYGAIIYEGIEAVLRTIEQECAPIELMDFGEEVLMSDISNTNH
ncbi:MAG: DNA-protecting protein DprA [Thermoplasmata archaeon]|nr:DNA-protecting protein DprA [Thermoplasmata archaeon]